MQITLIHGSDTAKSLKRLNEIKFINSNKGFILQEIKVNSNLSLAEELTQNHLFGEKYTYLIKGIDKFSNKDLLWLNNNYKDKNVALVIFAENQVPAGVIKKFPSSILIQKFDIPKLIFKFLASFYPKNTKQAISLLHQIKEDDAPELIIAILGRYLKDLYIAKTSPSSLLYPDWRKSKLIWQSNHFTNNSLKKAIWLLADYDQITKTSDVKAISMLDILILKSLE